MELMIAQKIKKYRKERELTQDALASVLTALLIWFMNFLKKVKKFAPWVQ